MVAAHAFAKWEEDGASGRPVLAVDMDGHGRYLSHMRGTQKDDVEAGADGSERAMAEGLIVFKRAGADRVFACFSPFSPRAAERP